VNLAGGYHHAGRNKGGGFWVFAEAPLALATLRDENKISSALVVDTDAHQGNGTADAIRSWSWAHILDFFEEDISPGQRSRKTLQSPFRQVHAALNTSCT